MKSNRTIKNFTVFSSVILINLILVMHAFALGVDTHKAINSYIADENSAIYGSDLHSYLKNNLGMQDGVKTLFNSKMAKEWISDGGEYEDSGIRPLNHFLNPITNQGLLGNYSAVAWATLPVGVQPLSPISSWNDVRDYYFKALTSADKATRENYFALTFQGVGQVMHLVEDMSVPAHVRHDIHPPPFWNDGYENWAKKNINDATQVSGYSAYGDYTPFNTSLFLIPQLFDTAQYNGTNPGITLSNNIGLAEFTNANFLSSDTIFKDFTYPDWSNLQPYEQDIAPGKTAIYQRKTGSGLNIEHFVRGKIYYDRLPSSEAFRGLMLDDNVHKDYAQFLIPRAIGYSSQVLSYFFRGQLEAELGDGNIKIKNASSETISGGKFELYYDNANGERNLLTSAEANTLASGEEQTITFSPPPEGASSYMLVYKGQLGSESDAIIGKYIPTEFVVITVSLSGISGENLTKKSVLVWHPASNSLARAPIDNADADFQKWYKEKKQVDDQSPLFVGGVSCGLAAAYSERPSGCQPFIPGMIDTAWRYGTIDGAGSVNAIGQGYDVQAFTNFNGHMYPLSWYWSVLLPQSPTAVSGFRTRKTFDISGVFTIGTDVPYYITGSESGDNKEMYYGPLGYMGEFPGTYELHGDIVWYRYPHGSITYDIPYSDPTNLGSEEGRWFHLSLDGQYDDKVIADICVVQFIGLTSTYEYKGDAWINYYPPPEYTYTFDTSRTILVSAQAIYTLKGTTGYDWVAKGRNEALETQIIAAINMAYPLNGIPANEIRITGIRIEIVK